MIQDMFFLKPLQELEREVRTPEMEEYDLCLEWSEGYPDPETEEWVEPVCLEWMDPKPMKLKSMEVDQEEYTAYVFNFTRKESYNFCTEWTYTGEDEEGNPIQLIEPQCVSFEVRNHDVPYSLELSAVKVGEHDNKDVIHMVSPDPWLVLALKTDPDYLCDSYEAMDEEVKDEVMETIYEVDEMVDGEMKKVRKTKKTKKWKDGGRTPTWKEERIPHKFAGVDA